MKIDFKKYWEKIKDSYKKLSAKTKKLLLYIMIAVAAALIILVAFIATSKNNYKVLFPGMSDEESVAVFAVLREMDASPKIDSNGQVTVPKEKWDDLVFELNGRGYPKTAPSYDTFTNLTGFTATEFEMRTGLIFQAQDLMRETLIHQTGIADAAVKFTVPEKSNYVWEENSGEKSTAGVTVTMKPGYTLTPERVSAIKHLASTSVPNLSPEDVVVVDSKTGMEVLGVEESTGLYSTTRLDFERRIAKNIEQSVVRLLSGKYGPDGVTAVATVALDYDKMLTESKQYQEGKDGTGTGIVNHFDEAFTSGGENVASGIVGEENNTDAPPIYPSNSGDARENATDYRRNIDYDVSYIMTQIEKGEPVLKKASVAVIVDDYNFTEETEETLTELISKAVNISMDNIKVTNLNLLPEPTSTDHGAPLLTQKQLILIGLGIVLLILIIIGIILFVRKKKKAKEDAEAKKLLEEEEKKQQELQKEIAEHKKKLQDEAMAQVNSKESAVAADVREFAKENPEIAATLLRQILREEK